ncbi:MAG: hypothetical protein IPM34_13275 [Saprospiraceae bacterium]|nr:hypothetical protein [Saprospiraceae bacterium]
MKPGTKPTTRLVSGNLFKGKNRGQDLSFEFLNAKGALVSGLDDAIQKTMLAMWSLMEVNCQPDKK